VLNEEKFICPEPWIVGPCAMPECVAPVGTAVDEKRLTVSHYNDIVVVGDAVSPSVYLNIPAIDMIEVAVIDSHIEVRRAGVTLQMYHPNVVRGYARSVGKSETRYAE